MARKKKEPVNIPPALVTIRVYPFAGDKPIAGWIELDTVVTVCGPVSPRIRVEVDRPDKEEKTWDWYLQAIPILARSHKGNCTVVCRNGSRMGL